MKTIWLLFAAVACTLAAHANPLDDKVKAFNAAVRASQPKDAATNPMSRERFYSLVEAPSSPETESSIEQMIHQVMSTQSDPAVQKAGQEVLDEIKAARKARTDAFKVKVDAVLGPIPAIIAKAAKPADLDQSLNDIQDAQQGQRSYGYGNSEEVQSLSNRLNSAYQFVSLWQDFLSQRGNGNIQEALNTLRNLQNQRGAGETMIPRSQILDQINTLQAKQSSSPNQGGPPRGPDINPILDGIKTLDDLTLAVRNLGTNSNFGEPYEIAQLKHYAFMYEQAKNGMPVTLESSPQNYGVMTPQPGFSRVASMLYAYLLPRFLGSTAPVPNANEPTNDYLDRVVAAAESSQDWTLLQRAITAKIRISQNRSQNPGVQFFLAGINQEIAGQYSLAVGSYENALKSSDEYTPAKVIGDRIATLKKDHPTEYEEGMKRFLNPPVPNYAYNPYMYNPYAQPGAHPGVMPGMPGAGANPPVPVAPRSSTPATNVAPASPSPSK